MTDFSEPCSTCDGTDVSPLGPSGCPDCHEGRVFQYDRLHRALPDVQGERARVGRLEARRALGSLPRLPRGSRPCAAGPGSACRLSDTPSTPERARLPPRRYEVRAVTDFSEPCSTCEGTDVSPLGPSGCPDCHEGRVPARRAVEAAAYPIHIAAMRGSWRNADPALLDEARNVARAALLAAMRAAP